MIVIYIVLTLLFVLVMSVLISDAIKFDKQFKQRQKEISKTHHIFKKHKTY